MNAITVLKKGEKYVALFRFDYETKDHVKAQGFRFDGVNKEWYTTDPHVAAKLDDKIAPLPLESAEVTTSDVTLPVPNNLDYLPFQKAGIEQLILRKDALLADEMGLGKTVQVIGVINALTSIKRALIICPASLKINWESELKRWLTRRFTIVVASSKPDAQVSNALIRAFRFTDEVRTDSDEESNYVGGPANPPHELRFGALDAASSRDGACANKSTILPEKLNDASISVGNSNAPWVVSRSGTVLTDPTFAVDNASHVSNDGNIARHVKDGSVPPDKMHRLSHQPDIMVSQGAIPDVQLPGDINRFHAVLDALESCKQFRITYFSGTCQGIILILNYDIVEHWRPTIDAANLDMLCCDESHYLKNNKSQRTQNIVGYWDNDPAKRIYPIRAKRRVFLTGTPVLNRPKELWTTVRALDRHGLGTDWHAFHTRYCAGYKDRFGWQIDGASNLDELQGRLRSSIMLRRKKADVLKELPPKRRQIIMLEPVTLGAKQALKNEEELKATEDKIEALRAEVEALSVNQADAKYRAAVQKLASLESVAFTETSKVRHRTALAKLPMVMDHLVNVLTSEDKIVVFAHHHDVIDSLVEGLAEYGVVSFDGRTNLERRQAAVDVFQNDPKTRVIIGSIGAMGSGWTLTAASYVAFTELDWVPGNMSQAEDRLHRIGQTESILVQHLMLNGSFDGRMAKTIVSKQQVIERATG